MNSNRTRLVTGILGAMVLSAPLTAAAGPNVTINNLKGTLQISQGVPCGGVVEAATSIADGRMDLSTSPVRTDGVSSTVVDLTRLEMFFTPFSADAECLGLKAHLEYREIGVRLASSISFTAQSTGDGQFRFVIPREQFLIYESVVTNLPVPQPMTAYKRPSEDVTGEIDMRNGTAQLRVVLSSRLHVTLGCVDNGKRCAIDEVVEGTQTANVAGRMHAPGTDSADKMPPTLSCTPLSQPQQHQVVAADDRGGRLSVKLGSFALDNGEVIQVEETGRPGARFLGTVGPDKVRHFQVGKGEALILATDAAGNVARAACR